MNAIGFEHHDHATCIASTLRLAEDNCAQRGLKFTPVRRRSLEILLREHRAMAHMIYLLCLRTMATAHSHPWHTAP